MVKQKKEDTILDSPVNENQTNDIPVLIVPSIKNQTNDIIALEDQITHIKGQYDLNESSEKAKDFFELKGNRYSFTEAAPKKLQVDGIVSYLDELINDECAMINLILGNSVFVQKIK